MNSKQFCCAVVIREEINKIDPLTESYVAESVVKNIN
jgi:hypothetical protein